MAQQLEALVADKIAGVAAGSNGEIIGARNLAALVKAGAGKDAFRQSSRHQ